jgi:LCP family protein required for cell wall assembly
MRLTKIQIFQLSILILASLTVLMAFGYILISWNRPLSSPLSLPTEFLDPERSTQVQETLENRTQEPELTLSPGVTPTPTIKPVCGGPPVLNILVAGVASEGYRYGLADAVRVVRVDYQNPGVSALALPRDLWVQIPGLERYDVFIGKLNQAYFYGTEGMGFYSGSAYGSGLLAETLLYNYDYRVDRYLAVNLASFRMIIDAIDGIDVYLPVNVYKPVFGEPELFLEAGYHRLYGEQAELLARQRITIGDFGRINNQTIILRAIAAKMLTPSGLAAVPRLVDQLKENVKTDLSPADISQLICLAGMIDLQNDMQFQTLPEDLLVQELVYDPRREETTAALIGNEEEIRLLLSDFYQGLWP